MNLLVDPFLFFEKTTMSLSSSLSSTKLISSDCESSELSESTSCSSIITYFKISSSASEFSPSLSSFSQLLSLSMELFLPDRDIVNYNSVASKVVAVILLILSSFVPCFDKLLVFEILVKLHNNQLFYFFDLLLGLPSHTLNTCCFSLLLLSLV